MREGSIRYSQIHPPYVSEKWSTLVSAWKDPEDYLLVEVALALKADAIVTRNQKDFPKGLVKVLDCNEFFAWMRDERGLVYDEVLL